MKLFYALSFIVLSSFQTNAQSGPTAAGRDAAAKITRFYPNPATSVINFDIQKDLNDSYSFQIFSFLGKKMYDVSNVTPKTVVNLGDFYRGIYIFQLRDRNGHVVDSGKFQVSK